MSGSLGLESGTVRVVPYDPAWQALFAAEAARIRAALDGLPLRLEHMGSTGVPGLAGGFLAGSWLEQEFGLEGARPALLFAAGATGLGMGAYSGAAARIPGRWRRVHP